MDKRITILVIDANEAYADNLCKSARENEEFFDAQYALNGSEGFEMLRLLKPEVVIIDFLMPVLDAMGFLRLLTREYRDEKPFVIINSFSIPPTMMAMAAENGADYFMIKPQPAVEVCNTIAAILRKESIPKHQYNEKEDDLDIKITRFLHCMGVPAHLNGYRYIRSSLKLALENLGAIMPITKNLYPYLAKEYNKTPYCIERAIRHAIKVSWDRGNKKIINDIFGYSPDTPYMGCPTNSEYIAMVADDLKMRIKHNISI